MTIEWSLPKNLGGGLGLRLRYLQLQRRNEMAPGSIAGRRTLVSLVESLPRYAAYEKTNILRSII